MSKKLFFYSEKRVFFRFFPQRAAKKRKRAVWKYCWAIAIFDIIYIKFEKIFVILQT